MATNVDNRMQGPQFHYTRQTSFLCSTFVAGSSVTTPLAGDGQQPSGIVLGPATGTYDFNIGALPSTARVCRAFAVTAIVFTGGTCTIALGNVAGGAQFVAAVAFGAALGFVSYTIVAAQVADYVTTPTLLWARIVVSAGTLTAGQADIFLEYVDSHGPVGQF